MRRITLYTLLDKQTQIVLSFGRGNKVAPGVEVEYFNSLRAVKGVFICSVRHDCASIQVRNGNGPNLVWLVAPSYPGS